MVGIDLSMLQNLVLPLPASTFVKVMSVMNLVTFANAGLSEFKGKNMQYSKFVNWEKKSQDQIKTKQPTKIDAKIGMLTIYTPAFVFGASSFILFPDEGFRFLLVRLALTVHFLKRVLEVLFVHKFGGSGVALDAAITISISYVVTTITMIYTQHLSSGFPEPSIDMKYAGIGIFLLGIAGNFYHHYILSRLRKEGEKEYKIPKGGLFNQVICPHYLFEVLGFVGVFCISQTLYSLSYTVGATMYLMGRSYATRKWYLSKFEDFPKDVKAMIPFIF